MRVRVRFRYDPQTGQVEYFRVDDISGNPPRADHDETHDRIAAEVAGVIETGALIDEVTPEQQAARWVTSASIPELHVEEPERNRDD
jgi:FtsH ternary system domain X3